MGFSILGHSPEAAFTVTERGSTVGCWLRVSKRATAILLQPSLPRPGNAGWSRDLGRYLRPVSRSFPDFWLGSKVTMSYIVVVNPIILSARFADGSLPGLC